MQRSSDATALIGLDGFVVLAQLAEHDELFVLIETTADRAWCRECGQRAVGHGRREVAVRDLPVAGRPVRLVWRKRIWRCPGGRCTRKTWSECSEVILARQSLTERARREICRQVGQDARSVAGVARDFGVGWACAMDAVRVYGSPLVDDPDRLESRVGGLGLDETAFLKASANRRRQMVTGMVDLDRHLLLDVVEGRSGAVVRDWIDQRSDAWRHGVRVGVVDPFRGYANAIKTHLPNAKVVADHFHLIRLGNRAVDDVRRRVQNDTLGHRGRKDDPLYRIRKLLLVAHDRLDDHQRERIVRLLTQGDPHGEVCAAYLAKELLREVFDADGVGQARQRLAVFYRYCTNADVRELDRLAKTIALWEPELLNYFRTGRASNGPTEGINLLIKKIKRVGHGFRNFDNYRLRLLLHAGIKWQTPPTTRVRGRQPAFAA